jgi:hypothetical protein
MGGSLASVSALELATMVLRAVIDVTDDGFVLRELAPQVTLEEVIAATGAPLAIDPSLVAASGAASGTAADAAATS